MEPLIKNSIVKSTILREIHCRGENLNRAGLKLSENEYNSNSNTSKVDRIDNGQGQQTNHTGHNTPFWVLRITSQKQVVLCQTGQSRVPPTCTDTGEKGGEEFSLATSNLFLQSNENEIQKDVHLRSANENDNHSSTSGNTHDEDQKYWLQSTEEYNDVVKVRPKYRHLWPQQQKSLREDKLKSKIESGKLPAHCGFMKTKPCNTEVKKYLSDKKL